MVLILFESAPPLAVRFDNNATFNEFKNVTVNYFKKDYINSTNEPNDVLWNSAMKEVR